MTHRLPVALFAFAMCTGAIGCSKGTSDAGTTASAAPMSPSAGTEGVPLYPGATHVDGGDVDATSAGIHSYGKTYQTRNSLDTVVGWYKAHLDPSYEQQSDPSGSIGFMKGDPTGDSDGVRLIGSVTTTNIIIGGQKKISRLGTSDGSH